MSERVLNTFIKDGRLVSMPAKAAKRRIVLEHIVTVFEPGVRISEREVDAALRSFYEQDWVSLRRYLIDATPDIAAQLLLTPMLAAWSHAWRLAARASTWARASWPPRKRRSIRR